MRSWRQTWGCGFWVNWSMSMTVIDEKDETSGNSFYCHCQMKQGFLCLFSTWFLFKFNLCILKGKSSNPPSFSMHFPSHFFPQIAHQYFFPTSCVFFFFFYKLTSSPQCCRYVHGYGTTFWIGSQGSHLFRKVTRHLLEAINFSWLLS